MTPSLEEFEHLGRRTQVKGYQSPAAWISDLVALHKFILLCNFCKIKFDYRKQHYRRFYVPNPSGGYTMHGKCDACKQDTRLCGGGTGYIHEEEYSKVCLEPSEVRRRYARAKHYARSTWASVNNKL